MEVSQVTCGVSAIEAVQRPGGHQLCIPGKPCFTFYLTHKQFYYRYRYGSSPTWATREEPM